MGASIECTPMNNPIHWQKRALEDDIASLVSDAVRLHYLIRPSAEAARLTRDYRDCGLTADEIATAILKAATAANANVERQSIGPAPNGETVIGLSLRPH